MVEAAVPEAGIAQGEAVLPSDRSTVQTQSELEQIDEIKRQLAKIGIRPLKLSSN
ncbi:hypothetical protein GYA49_01210 [Candidatus Beckwithbacteria bacterium]|nr:hypothetical protein [Candidatus Beckwithbacteria bacterium]